MPEPETPNDEQEPNDLEIAELANKELRDRDAKIAKLTKDLAQAKLYSTVDSEEEPALTREECIKRLGDSCISNYDYAEAVVGLVDLELADGKPNPLGKNGEEVYKFFKDVLEECGDDKSRFTSIYQSKLGADDPKIAMAYKARQQNN